MEVASQAQTGNRSFFLADKQGQTDDSGAETEARARRKFQRTAENSDNGPFRKPSLPASAMKSNPDTQATLANRRRSTLRENKAPLGPRPLGFSPSKRVFSEGTATSHFNHRSLLQNSTSEPVLEMAKEKGDDNRYSFGNASLTTDNGSESAASFEFLPAVSFDDFQTSITSYEPQPSPRLSKFPSAGTGEGIFSNEEVMGRSKESGDTTSAAATSAFKPGKTQPSARRQNTAAPRQSSLAVQDGAPSVPTATPALSLRTRRQSHAAASTAAPSTASARPPRKSVGPGLLTSMMQNNRTQTQQTSSTPMSAPAQPNVTRTPSITKTSRRTTMAPTTGPAPDISRLTAATRSSKAKSLQPPPRASATARTPEPNISTDGGRAHMGKNLAAPSANTPSSSGNKRQSGRLSGLGARTISPTDARRLKRLSMMQGATPAPKSPPTPQPEPSDARATTRSPSLIPRKASMTPSSARNTPDSGLRRPRLSLSASSSYQSLRGSNSNASGPSRASQTPSLSKLPTPKSRNVYSSAERHEEVVPPVPAIPKAYESPKDQIDTPFFHPRKVSGTAENSADGDNSMLLTTPGPVSAEKTRDRRALTVTAGVSPEKAPALPAVKQKALQPLRLPPLNLLPLSTPTASRIASFPAPSQEVERREATPPPRRSYAKTPSTPMTASKATFYRRHDEGQGPPVSLRSSSSHYALRSAVDHVNYDDTNNSIPMPMSAVEMKRQTITPFTSGSLPKHSGEYARFRNRLADEYTLGNHDIEVQTSKPMGPRPRTASKSVKDTSSINTRSSNEEQEPSTPGSSLRRKLSLGWRRSSSKSANSRPFEEALEQSKRQEMPPPKLPASATWSGPIGGIHQTTSASSARPSLESTRRKGSIAASFDSAHMADGTTMSKQPTVAEAPMRQLHSEHPHPQPGPTPRSSSWSILGSMNRSLGSKPSSAGLARGKTDSLPRLDKDDLAANEEMKKLSSRRREVDTAAKETDELRKLATPKSRMTPAQAVQASAGLLNIFEKGEIIDYKEGVYFCGSKSAKKHVGDISAAATNNYGYDDERGDYNIVLRDHLAYRFEVIDVLGKGSFGQVVRCIDHKNGGLCAVKIIRNKKRFHQQALVEVNILQRLKEWDPDEAHATLTITSSFYFRSHLCIVTPCLSINLYELIRAHSFTGFSIPLIRRFARQLLSCLCLLQSKRVIHCDLKPENILLCDPRRADIRVIDFGSSCKADEKVYTYIQSRFYRSPEVILGSEYGLGIDMWSLGCILAELYTGYPIFPGENEQEQLACIMEIFGPPSRDIIEKATRRKLFFDSALKPRVTVSSKGRRRRPSSKTLSASLKCEDEAFLDFIAQCLRWDPERRLRPDQAVSHPFITNEPMRRVQDERRARIRASAAVPNSHGFSGGIPSPVKRVHTTTAAVSTSSAQAFVQQTPVRDRTRPLPDTPSTALRNGMPIAYRATDTAAGSPVKGPAKRQSAVAANTFASQGAVAGSKRASNGTLLQTGLGNSLPRVGSGKVDLAGAAARESMGAVARWR